MADKMSSEEIKAEYTSSLTDLTYNSKPLINMLTILAEENRSHAADIVEAIETHLSKVHTEVKLPILYLIDCIVKNIGATYMELFSQNIVSTFSSVFKVVDEKTRSEMYKLRQTWNDVFPQKKLYATDLKIRQLDPAWPVTAQPTFIHLNPKFLKNQEKSPPNSETLIMQKQLIEKQRELLELQQKKLELELLQTQVKLRENSAVDPRAAAYAPRATPTNAPRINPPNPALVAAAKPVNRDPRLQKQPTANQENVKAPVKDPRLANKEAVRHESNKPKSPQKSRQETQKSSSKSSKTSNKNGSDSSLKSSSNSSLETDKKKSPSKTKRKDKYDDKKSSGKSRKDSETSQTQFREVKIKNKNFMRRHRSSSRSPERDDDMRTVLVDEKNKDVDFRQIPGAIGGKKRSSTEALDTGAAKKSKSEVFDVLFGNEDTDLRKLAAVGVERPPTPPPPIISGEIIEINSDSPPKNNLDAIRAKLASATNRDKILAKSFHKKKLAQENDPRKNSASTPIVISAQDEQSINSGTMTKEQQNNLLNKILVQVEKNKLREAKREESLGNISTQTISDDDMEISYNSDEERAERERFKKEVYTPFTVNRDEPKQQTQQNEDPGYGKFRDQRGGGHWRGGGRRRHWDNNPYQGPHAMPQRPGAIRPWANQPGGFNWRPMAPPRVQQEFMPIEDSKSPENSSDMVVESTNRDDIHHITIDGCSRDIRYYDEEAVIFMDWDDPRDISFQNGVRKVSFNDTDSYMLSFNEPYKDLMVNGALCKVRLGVPSREIFINRIAYECYFGGPGITIELNGANTLVALEGPPPQVKIGTNKRSDLVAGRVNLIINAKILIPVFLDAKLQTFVLEGDSVTLKFVDSLKTVLINDCPFNVEFGGLPKPVTIHDRKHYIRFSVLPKGVKPGHVRIKDMEGQAPSAPLFLAEETSRDAFEMNVPHLPALGPGSKKRLESPERNSNSPNLFQNILQQTNLDVLSSVLANANSKNAPSTGGYQVENVPTNDISHTNKSASFSAAPTALPPNLNINDLFQKLVATGIVTTNNKEPAKVAPVIIEPPKPRRNPLEHLRDITFNRPETLKVRQQGLYGVLYAGMQCSSCGMRFPPEQSIHYSQHLDWHFRQNRKGKKNIRIASSRKWYYSLSDWKNYEEIEDLEEREKNFFDQQATQQEGAVEETEEEVEIPTVPAGDIAHETCEVCKDPFDQFFDEEKEEWHLRNAIRVEEKTYHPVCYEDYLKSLQDATMDESQMDTTTTEAEDVVKDELIPGLQIILDDDDDENTNSEVVIEESEDEEKPQEEQEKAEESPEHEDDGDDDDVILNEVAPVKIVVDDDDDLDYEADAPTYTPTPIKKEKSDIDDGFEDVAGLITMPNGGQIKIKAEPVDPDELPALETTDPDLSTSIDHNLDDDVDILPPVQHHTAPTSIIASMDGNVDLMDQGIPSMAPASKGIKINISKPLAVIAPREPIATVAKEPFRSSDLLEPQIDPSQPLPPGEEPVQLNLKPALQGVELREVPAVTRGAELSGLCSIM